MVKSNKKVNHYNNLNTNVVYFGWVCFPTTHQTRSIHYFHAKVAHSVASLHKKGKAQHLHCAQRREKVPGRFVKRLMELLLITSRRREYIMCT
jgi:hypothetical protein